MHRPARLTMYRVPTVCLPCAYPVLYLRVRQHIEQCLCAIQGEEGGEPAAGWWLAVEHLVSMVTAVSACA